MKMNIMINLDFHGGTHLCTYLAIWNGSNDLR